MVQSTTLKPMEISIYSIQDRRAQGKEENSCTKTTFRRILPDAVYRIQCCNPWIKNNKINETNKNNKNNETNKNNKSNETNKNNKTDKIKIFCDGGLQIICVGQLNAYLLDQQF